MPKHLTLHLESDSDTPDPTEYSGWEIVTFWNHRFITDKPIEDYLERPTKVGGKVDWTPRAVTSELQQKIDEGTAFVFSCYEHSGRHLFLLGEGHYDQWDSTHFAGIMLWNEAASNLGDTTEDRKKSAASFLEAYNQWAEGECYYYRIEDHDDDDEELDACGGFIGSDHFFQSVAEALKPYEGAKIKLDGECEHLAQYHKFLPEGATICDDFDEEDEE